MTLKRQQDMKVALVCRLVTDVVVMFTEYVAKSFFQAIEEYNFLESYEDGWVVRDFLTMYLRNSKEQIQK